MLPNGKYDILYDDSDTEAGVPRSRILLIDPKSGKAIPATPSGAQATVAGVPVGPSGPGGESPAPLVVGTRVEVNYRKSGNWFKGKVATMHDNGTFDVDYDDGDKEAGVVPAYVKVLGDGDKPIPSPGTAFSEQSGAASPGTKKAPPKADVKPTVLLLGGAGTGKSTLLSALGGQANPKPGKTMGFSQRKVQYGVDGVPYRVQFYDVAGSWPKKWPEYISEAHAIVYMLDAVADTEAHDKATAIFQDTLAQNAVHLAGKPMLLFANKVDGEGAREADQVLSPLMEALPPGFTAESIKRAGGSVHPQKHGGEQGSLDKAVEEGLDWLLRVVVKKYATLDQRVAEAKAEDERRRAQAELDRNKRVMTKILREKAFPTEGDPVECYEKDDALEFLAMESNLHDPEKPNHGLPEIAVGVAVLVGFQKVAMQMCGAMVCPISKKKKKLSWEQVLSYVKDRREDAGLEREV